MVFRIRALLGGLLATGLFLSGCTPEPTPPPAPPTTEPRPFTLATTSLVDQPDPAGATTGADQEFAFNVFQRLMRKPVGEQVLKPDLATDCYFPSEQIYECEIPADASFANGEPLTVADVKFSIERAKRLRPDPGTDSPWNTLHNIKIVDEVTIQFVLNRPDTEFGYLLAGPRASIVDDGTYPADRFLADPQQSVGSGPFAVARYQLTDLLLTRNEEYVGPYAAMLDEVALEAFADSASIEEAMAKNEVDAVWRGLSDTAHTRLSDQIRVDGQYTDSGFSQDTLAGGRVLRLIWNPDSALSRVPQVRTAVRDGLQDERTLDSIVPPNIPGYHSSFAQGGLPEISHDWSGRHVLRIAVDPRMPDATDLSAILTARLEATGGFTVHIVGPADDADLRLDDAPSATDTAVAWLQAYLDRPTVDSTVALTLLRTNYGELPAHDDAHRGEVLATMQALAARDATVVPIRQTDSWLYLGPQYAHDEAAFGPGRQLGFWGFRDID